MALKIKPCLKFDDAPRQCILRATEVRTINRRREELKRRKIQAVESIEEVCLDLEKRSFSEKSRHAGSLREAEVH